MGGNVIINYALRKETTLKGIVASSPFLKLAFQPPNWKLSLGKILQKIAPSITMSNEINPDYLSRNKTEVEKYKNDPLVHDKISPNYSLTFIETGKWAIENAHKLKIPALLLHGTSDKIIDFKGTEAFSKNTEFATLKRYKDGYHELHTDLCKEEFMEYITVWLNSEL
jgi:acylglycerol lipase